MDIVRGGFCEDFPQICLFIDGYGKNDCVRQRSLFQECIQLTKLIDAERSPVTAIEHEDDVLFPPVARKSNLLVVAGHECEVRGLNSHMYAIEVGRKQIGLFLC